MPSFDIGEFRSRISQRGVMKPSKFRVEIPVPRGLQGQGTSSIVRDLEFYCDAGEIPMVDVTTSDIRRHGYGPLEKRAYGVNFNDVPLRFIADGNGEVYAFFNAWMNLVVNFDSTQGPLEEKARGGVAHEVAYKDEYAVDLNVYVYDDNGHEIIKTTLLEAWPTRVESIKLDWSDTGSIARVGTIFTFRDWHSSTISPAAKLIGNVLTSLAETFFRRL